MNQNKNVEIDVVVAILFFTMGSIGVHLWFEGYNSFLDLIVILFTYGMSLYIVFPLVNTQSKPKKSRRKQKKTRRFIEK